MEVIEIEINKEDYKTIKSFTGYSVGYNNKTIKIDSIEDKILEPLQNYLSNAQGVIIEFTIHSEQSMVSLFSEVEKISDMTNSESSIVFGAKTNDSIDIDKCEFYILITGLNEI